VLSIAAVGLIAFAVWQPRGDVPAFETTTTAELLDGGPDDGLAVGDGWFVGRPAAYMNPGAQPSISLAFPGPYSPLIVEPPLRTGGRVRFTSLLE
jgi:hypothetical protein